MLRSYGSIFALGHKAIAELLFDPVVIQEKVDGSQISFGVVETETRELSVRSKGAELNLYAPDKMFAPAVRYIQSISDRLTPGWIYRGEYLAKPKHNALAYTRVPRNNIALFDVDTDQESFLDQDRLNQAALVLDLEVVPLLYHGRLEDVSILRSLLESDSFLGGQKIEGVVVKNYHRFGLDKHILMGKFVSEAFKEVHAAEWKIANPKSGDVVDNLIRQYRTPARWDKAVAHLRDAGELLGEPKDIGLLFREVPADVKKECEEEIKKALWDWAWPKISRGIMAGVPEWYKAKLMAQQFENGTDHDHAV